MRTDNNIVTTSTTQRGYAVFDLSSLPSNIVVNSVTIGFYTNTYGGSGVPSGWNTYGYAGDLSLATVPATLFANMVAGTSISTATYGTGTGNQVLASTAASTAFVEANAGGRVSISFTGGNARIYTIRGESGVTTSTTAVNHAPYMTITYCVIPTGVTATAAPNPVCEGDVLTLTSTATGATDYSWTGPGSYSSIAASPTLTAATTSGGTYTLTAINACGTFSATATASTAIVTVNPLPAALTGASQVCTGNAVSVNSTTFGGSYTSSDPTVATIGLSTGLVIGVMAGTATMSYTMPTGCYVTRPITVNDPPTAIGGPTEVCENGTITLTNGVSGGLWSSATPGLAIVGSVSGIVTGLSAGVATISYTTGGCVPVSYTVTVHPVPAAIGGPSDVCAGSMITVTNTTAGGTWSSSSISTALVGATSGTVTGVSAGSTNIIYTLTATGCQSIMVLVVNPLPAAMSGPTNVCEGSNITLTDPTPGGSFSSVSPEASVTFGGVVTGVSAGTADVTYTLASTGCYVTRPVVVDAIPASIAGTAVLCENTTTALTNADAGGIWSSANVTVATVGSSSGIVTGVAAPGTFISYTLPSGCYNTVLLTINPAPTAAISTIGTTTFCTGGSVLLVGSSGPGLTYQWSNAAGPIIGETNGTYTATTTDAFEVAITNAFGCTTTSAPEAVTAGIVTVVDHATPLNFCTGSTIALTANTGGAVGFITYQWLKNGVAIPGAVFVNYTAATSGLYTAAVSISGGSGVCNDTATAVNVLVNALPTPAVTYTGTVLSTSTYPTYQWYLNTVSIPGATGKTYVPVINGSYRVRVSDAIGCSGYSNPYNVTSLSVSEISAQDIKIYPNPATEHVFIESPVAVSGVITSIEGKVLMEKAGVRDFDIRSLSSGVYLIVLYDTNGSRVAVQKLIKE